MSGVLERLRKQAGELGRSIVFPETSDERVISAAQRFAQAKLGTAIVLDPVDSDKHALTQAGVQIVHAADILDSCIEALCEARRHRGMTAEQAREELDNPLLVAAVMVRMGLADAAVAGSVASTADVIRAGLRGIGTAQPKGLVSSFFLMDFGDRVLTYADCGVVPYPNSSELADIAIAAADNHQRLTGETPLVAMLSFSTLGSADHASVQTVQAATALVRERRADIAVDGELQFDAAFVPEVAQRKAPHSRVAGHANVFVFPNLDAANIAYKISERLGGADALGPVVQGLAKPMMDLSRGCKVDDIVDVAVIAANLV